MMLVAIFHLACLALTLELIYRAPEYDGRELAEGGAVGSGEALAGPGEVRRAPR